MAIGALAVKTNALDRVEPLITPKCQDPAPEVRCAAFDALSGLGSETVVQPAIDTLQDPSWRVRASAIAALGRVRRKPSIPALIARMEQEEGRLVSDIDGVELQGFERAAREVQRCANPQQQREAEQPVEQDAAGSHGEDRFGDGCFDSGGRGCRVRYEQLP